MKEKKIKKIPSKKVWKSSQKKEVKDIISELNDFLKVKNINRTDGQKRYEESLEKRKRRKKNIVDIAKEKETHKGREDQFNDYFLDTKNNLKELLEDEKMAFHFLENTKILIKIIEFLIEKKGGISKEDLLLALVSIFLNSEKIGIIDIKRKK